MAFSESKHERLCDYDVMWPEKVKVVTQNVWGIVLTSWQQLKIEAQALTIMLLFNIARDRSDPCSNFESEANSPKSVQFRSNGDRKPI